MTWPHEGSDEVAEYTKESDQQMLDEADRLQKKGKRDTPVVEPAKPVKLDPDSIRPRKG